MSDVFHHYENLLGSIYSWSLGDFDARVRDSREFVAPFLQSALENKRALDLGCGTGVQTLALAQLGFAVTGIDFSPQILREYRQRTASLSVTVLESDISQFVVESNFDAAICFGDTLAHLPNLTAVQNCFSRVHQALKIGGVFLLSTRDHSKVYAGDSRFLLVQSDDIRTLTCCLEDAGPQVRVTDLVHTRSASGTTLQAHSYFKLRISPSILQTLLVAAGFVVSEEGSLQGQHVLKATRVKQSKAP